MSPFFNNKRFRTLIATCDEDFHFQKILKGISQFASRLNDKRIKINLDTKTNICHKLNDKKISYRQEPLIESYHREIFNLPKT